MIKILHGDAISLLRTMQSGCVDLVVSDLPYGQTQNAWDNPLPFASMWTELRRVTKPAAAICLMAAQPFAARLVCSNEEEFRYDLIWHKNKATGFLNANRQPLRAHEHVLIFYRASPLYTPQKTNGHEPGHKAKRAAKSSNYGVYEKTEYGGSTERHPTSVLSIPIINNDSPDKVHPTQKPVPLMEWLIASYSTPGNVVLDITAGSGTTGVAANNLNRHAILFELNPAYIEIAKRRCGL
jgi:DNA modification methylase